MGTKNQIYQKFIDEYRDATKEEKTKIINAIVKTTGSKRKSVIRRMRDFLLYPEGPPKKKRGEKNKVWNHGDCSTGDGVGNRGEGVWHITVSKHQ